MSDSRDTLEIRLHGRGGQGGVTCAKILAAVYAHLGKSVQTFGDYAGERSGAPVRAYTRVSDRPVTNRNKVYNPDHLLVLDPTLLGAAVVDGLAPGGLLLVNTPKAPGEIAPLFPGFRVATVDATSIARRHGIGTRSVVIVNTTIAGAFVRALGLPSATLEAAYRKLGLLSNLPASKEAYDQVQVLEVGAPAPDAPKVPPAAAKPSPRVLPLVDHRVGAGPAITTGSWRSQTPAYRESLAPCNAWCPAGNDVVGFIQTLAREGEAAAAAVLGRTTPLSAVCGRVCPAPCMEGCNRREYDGSVNIRALERWVADHHPVAVAVAPKLANPRRLAVIGGGPAGLAAAYEAAKLGHRVTIYESERELGGVLRTGIPSYRLPRDVLDREIAGILGPGVEARCGEFLTWDRIAALAKEYDAVILATGLQKMRGVEGPRVPGVEQGLTFLHRVNLGGGATVSGHVVVLGGGNTAMDCARSALRSGASKVTVAYRRTRLEMPAIAEEIDEASHEGIELRFLSAPAGFAWNGSVQAVKLAAVELGEPDASGRRSPVVTDRVESLPCDHVLLALGQSADLSILPPGWNLDRERVVVEGKPSRIFAAGDLATGDGTVAHAIGNGRRAATMALREAGEDVVIFERPDRAAAVPLTDIRLDHFARAEAAREEQVAVDVRVKTFDEVHRGLRDALETHRCFSCGHCTRCDTCLVYCPEGVIRRKDGDYAVDYSNCKGCGICVTECPRRAMEMVS